MVEAERDKLERYRRELDALRNRPGAATDWVASLSPWPEEFGLDGMRPLSRASETRSARTPAIHVVGTNGKSTATRTIAELLRSEGSGQARTPRRTSRAGTSGWIVPKRVRAGRRADSCACGGARRDPVRDADRGRAAEFAEPDVDVAVIEAGLGGRLDATNVVDAPVVLLTNVALEHTEVLGETGEEIAKEKLAVAHAARVVVMSDNTS